MNDEDTWTLTYAIRGYAVQHDEISDIIDNDYIVANTLLNMYKIYSDDCSDDSSDDINNGSKLSEKSSIIYKDLLKTIAKEENNVVLIEYESVDLNCEVSVIVEYEDYNVYFNDNLIAKFINLPHTISPSLIDHELHSDEGRYNVGINLYKHYNNNFNNNGTEFDYHDSDGIVLIQEQNSKDSLYYAMAIYDEILVPDLKFT